MPRKNRAPRIPFTPAEDELLRRLYHEHGPQWAVICRLMAEHGFSRRPHAASSRTLVLTRMDQRNATLGDNPMLFYSVCKPWTPASKEEFFDARS